MSSLPSGANSWSLTGRINPTTTASMHPTIGGLANWDNTLPTSCPTRLTLLLPTLPPLLLLLPLLLPPLLVLVDTAACFCQWPSLLWGAAPSSSACS
jgi:hypothetical protein